MPALIETESEDKSASAFVTVTNSVVSILGLFPTFT